LTLGPADLAQDLDVFGTPDQARVLNEKRDLVLDACRRHNKVCSMLVNSADEARRWRELGALLLVYSTDVDVIYDGFNVIAKQLRGM